MKYLFTLFLAVSLISCDKKEDSADEKKSTDPVINSVKFSSAFAGGDGNGTAATLNITIPEEGSVSSLAMTSETNQAISDASNPKTGTVTLADASSPFDTNKSYYFVFKLKNGSQIKSKLYKKRE